VLRRRFWLLVASLGTAVVVVWSALFYLEDRGTASVAERAPLVVRRPAMARARSMTLLSLNGKPASLSAYSGHIVFVNLWATWCPPCRAEMPDLQRFYDRYKSRNLVVLGIDEGEAHDPVQAFVNSVGARYPVLLDRRERYASAYRAIGLPTSFIVSPSGFITTEYEGALSFSEMVAAVKTLLQATKRATAHQRIRSTKR